MNKYSGNEIVWLVNISSCKMNICTLALNMYTLKPHLNDRVKIKTTLFLNHIFTDQFFLLDYGTTLPLRPVFFIPSGGRTIEVFLYIINRSVLATETV